MLKVHGEREPLTTEVNYRQDNDAENANATRSSSGPKGIGHKHQLFRITHQCKCPSPTRSFRRDFDPTRHFCLLSLFRLLLSFHLHHIARSSTELAAIHHARRYSWKGKSLTLGQDHQLLTIDV